MKVWPCVVDFCKRCSRRMLRLEERVHGMRKTDNYFCSLCAHFVLHKHARRRATIVFTGPATPAVFAMLVTELGGIKAVLP